MSLRVVTEVVKALLKVIEVTRTTPDGDHLYPGPYRRPIRRVLLGSWGGGCFPMGEVPLQTTSITTYEDPQRFLGGTCDLEDSDALLGAQDVPTT